MPGESCLSDHWQVMAESAQRWQASGGGTRPREPPWAAQERDHSFPQPTDVSVYLLFLCKQTTRKQVTDTEAWHAAVHGVAKSQT